MNNDIHIPDSFNRLAAYLDGRLSPEEMMEMDDYVASNPNMSNLVSDIEDLDLSIAENANSNILFTEMELPEIAISNDPVFSDDFLLESDSFVAADASLSLEDIFSEDFPNDTSSIDDLSSNFDDTDPSDIL